MSVPTVPLSQPPPRWLVTGERQWCATERRWFHPSTCHGACLGCRRQLIREAEQFHATKEGA